jgi:uncharacterized protein (DUF433 family)
VAMPPTEGTDRMSLDHHADAATTAADHNASITSSANGTGPKSFRTSATRPGGPAHIARERAHRLRWDAAQDDPEFQSIAGLLMTDLTPEGPVETYLAEMILHTFRRLYLIRRASDDPRVMRMELSLHRSLTRTLKLLEGRQRERKKAWGKKKPPTKAQPGPLEALAEIASEAAVEPDREAPRGRPVDDDVDPVEAVAEGVNWRDRLEFDPKVSEESPAVKGTWVTARHVSALVTDGWSWDEIYRAHPELTERDIRACLDYTIEVLGGLRD